MWWVKILKKKLSFFYFFYAKKKKTLSLDNGRKKKLNPLFTNNKLQLPFSFLVHVSWFFLCIFFFLHIKGMPIPFKFHQVLFISRLFFLAQLPLKTLALSRIARLCQMNSYQQIIHLCQITNSFFFFFFYGCYIQATLVEYLTTWIPVEHKSDKPIVRSQIVAQTQIE